MSNGKWRRSKMPERGQQIYIDQFTPFDSRRQAMHEKEREAYIALMNKSAGESLLEDLLLLDFYLNQLSKGRKI